MYMDGIRKSGEGRGKRVRGRNGEGRWDNGEMDKVYWSGAIIIKSVLKFRRMLIQ